MILGNSIFLSKPNNDNILYDCNYSLLLRSVLMLCDFCVCGSMDLLFKGELSVTTVVSLFMCKIWYYLSNYLYLVTFKICIFICNWELTPAQTWTRGMIICNIWTAVPIKFWMNMLSFGTFWQCFKHLNTILSLSLFLG